MGRIMRDSNTQAEIDFDMNGSRSNVITRDTDHPIEPLFDEADSFKADGEWVGEGVFRVWREYK